MPRFSTRRRRKPPSSSAGLPGARAYGGSNNANGDPAVGSNNVTASTFGFAGGMDYHVTPYTVSGFALAGAGTNWGLANALGTGRSDALQAGAYGISWFGPAYVAGALSFSNHWFTTNRSALGDQLPRTSSARATARGSKAAIVSACCRRSASRPMAPCNPGVPHAGLQRDRLDRRRLRARPTRR